jgi:hypothetical protein
MTEPWYFVYRITKNEELGDVDLGDRALAGWINAVEFSFSTYNSRSKQPNIH